MHGRAPRDREWLENMAGGPGLGTTLFSMQHVMAQENLAATKGTTRQPMRKH